MATPQATPTTTQTPLTPEQRLAREQQDRYARITRNVAIGGLIICPVIAFLPPRKMDLYTFSLGVGFYLSADHLAEQYTGRGLLQHFPVSSPARLPTEKAQETSRILKEREEIERARREGLQALDGNGESVDRRGVWRRLFYGNESEGWKERRIEEERRALAEGKTYTDIILDQIWEVWNWDKKKDGENEKGAGEGPTKKE